MKFIFKSDISRGTENQMKEFFIVALPFSCTEGLLLVMSGSTLFLAAESWITGCFI